MAADLVIKRFDPALAAASDFAGYHEVVTGSQKVDRANEPPLPLNELIGRLKTPFPGMGPVECWAGRYADRVVGVAKVHFLENENSDVALTEVLVHPEFRRRGLGLALLEAVLPELRAHRRRVVEGWQVVAGSAGQLWAEALGFQLARRITVQALLIDEVDRSSWDVEEPAGYRLHRWVGSAPDGLVGSYATARDAIHDAPLGESNYRWPAWTVARVRQAEAEWRAHGIEQRVVVAVHEATGQVAGLTEVGVHERRPDWGYQRDTAVLAAYRGCGLGRCLKGQMMRWLVSERPRLRRVQTTTGSENVHMIRVNHEVGFSTIGTLMAMKQDLSALESRILDSRH